MIDDMLILRIPVKGDLLPGVRRGRFSVRSELICVAAASRRIGIPKWTVRLFP